MGGSGTYRSGLPTHPCPARANGKRDESNMTDYLEIRNWDQFQHYRHRSPPWIKLHRDILASEDWVMLADASKLLMVVCMLVAAKFDGRVPNNPHYFKRVAYLDKMPDLTPLIETGFLVKLQADASTLQADASGRKHLRTNATPEKSKRESKSKSVFLCPHNPYKNKPQ